MTDATPLLPGLSPVEGKPLTASFDAGLMSSHGGLVVLREAAWQLGLTDVISSALPDTRDPTRVVHSYADMVTARMMAIAAGYEDCDDLDCLRTDPALMLACGRAPERGADLMSQSPVHCAQGRAFLAPLQDPPLVGWVWWHYADHNNRIVAKLDLKELSG